MIAFISFYFVMHREHSKANALVELCCLQEQVVLNSSSTLPTWDKAASNLTIHSSKNDNIENFDLGHTNVMSKGQSFILGTFSGRTYIFP